MLKITKNENGLKIEISAIMTIIAILATYFLGLAVVMWLFDGVIVAIYGSVLIIALLMTLSILVIMAWMILYNIYHILTPFVSKSLRRSETLHEQR